MSIAIIIHFHWWDDFSQILKTFVKTASWIAHNFNISYETPVAILSKCPFIHIDQSYTRCIVLCRMNICQTNVIDYCIMGYMQRSFRFWRASLVWKFNSLKKFLTHPKSIEKWNIKNATFNLLLICTKTASNIACYNTYTLTLSNNTVSNQSVNTLYSYNR